MQLILLNPYNFNTISQTIKISRSCESDILSYWLHCIWIFNWTFSETSCLKACISTNGKKHIKNASAVPNKYTNANREPTVFAVFGNWVMYMSNSSVPPTL